MSLWKGARARLASLRRDAAESRMEEEFRFHVDMQTEENIRRGMSPGDARRQALVAFGGAERHREGMRDGRGLRWFRDLHQDVRFALRGLRRTPVFAVVGIATIGLGVGVATALFSLANAVLHRLPPIPAAERVFVLNEYRSGLTSNGIEGERVPLERFEAYREATRDVFADLAGHRLHGVSLRTRGDAFAARATLYAGRYFDAMGVPPVLGRFPREGETGQVVISHALWQRDWGGAPDVVGSAVWVDGRAYTVAGVVSSRFQGAVFGTPVDVWLGMPEYVAGRPRTFDHWVTPFGRLRDGVGREGALAAVQAAGARIPDEDATIRHINLEPLGGLTGEGRRIAGQFLTLQLVAGLLVLFIAASNIAGMLLARAVARQRETAVRLAMGAGRWRLIRQLLSESLLLFLLGGGVGVLVAFWLTSLLSRIRAPAPGEVLELSATPDVRVLLFALVVSVVPALLFGLVPALQGTRPNLVQALREGTPGSGVRSVRLRSLFVTGQLAVAVLLLITAGLFVRSLQHGLNAEPGFDGEGVVVASLNLAPHGYDEAASRAFFDELTEGVRRLPGVSSVALARRVLLSGESFGTGMRAAGSPDDVRAVNVRMNTVDTAYFATLRIAFVAGRGFDARDVPGAPDAVVINQTAAAAFWPGEDPVGRVLREGPREMQVVGVVRDGLYVEYSEAPRPFAFVAAAQRPSSRMVLHVRSDGDPAAVAAHIRQATRALDANVALDFVQPLSTLTEVTLFPQRLAATLIGGLGLLGLVLASVGVYGVLMYHVAQRRHEFGVRIALGASAAGVARNVLGRSLRITAVGVVLGLAGAWFLARLLQGLIFGVDVRDPVTFVAVPLVLAAISLVAAWYPAFRAGRSDPVQVLRSD